MNNYDRQTHPPVFDELNATQLMQSASLCYTKSVRPDVRKVKVK